MKHSKSIARTSCFLTGATQLLIPLDVWVKQSTNGANILSLREQVATVDENGNFSET